MRAPLAALTLCALMAAPQAGPVLMDRVVAEVNDEVILLSQVLEEERAQGGQRGSPARQRLERREILEQLIDATLLLQEARRLGLEPPQELIAEAVDERLEEIQASWPDPQTFEAWLAANGLSLADLRRRLREKEADAWMRRSLVVTRVGAPPETIDLPAQVELDQILLACAPDAPEPLVLSLYQECLDLRARVQAGEDFATLAATRSDDPLTAPSGGALGLVEITALDPAIAQALEGLDAGDLTLPIRTEQGWHLLRVRRVVTPRQRWFMQAFEEAHRALTDELRRRAHVVIHLDEREP